MEPCPICANNPTPGTVPHTKRKMESGEDDPTDFKTVDICEKCGGGGLIPLDKRRIREPGNIADMSGFALSPSKGFWR